MSKPCEQKDEHNSISLLYFDWKSGNREKVEHLINKLIIKHSQFISKPRLKDLNGVFNLPTKLYCGAVNILKTATFGWLGLLYQNQENQFIIRICHQRKKR